MTRGIVVAPAAGDSLRERGDDVEIERLAGGAGLPWSARARRSTATEAGKRGEKMLGGKRPIQPHLQHADLFALRRQDLDRLARRLGARAHQDQDAFGVGRALIFEQFVAPPGQPRETGHGVRDDAGHCGVDTG